jgi:predicted secreted hydrolase
VVPRALAFPRDHGSHPAFRTEWWYITGWTQDEAGTPRGVQVTFFRSRPGVAEAERSAFAPVQILFAHAAVAEAAYGRLRHDQRAARAGLGLAHASEATTEVALDDWSLVLDGATYRSRIRARDFALDLAFGAPAPPLQNGDAGVSRKGPLPAQASYYYSRPQLAVTGSLTLDDRAHRVRGVAWLDHEWSSEYLAPGARGWDWTGINLDDGGALMAFRIRDAQGNALWSGGTRQQADGSAERLGREAVAFEPLRRWRSPRTGAEYPVAQRVTAGDLALDLVPLMDDQELDARGSVGAVYWEGAVLARSRGRPIGRGYLELTGYAGSLRL